MTTSHNLTREQVAALQAEIDAIRDEHLADLGEDDLKYIRKVMIAASSLRVAGRTMLMFGFGPVMWGAGVTALGLGKILENMEVGHNVMHGQYDWTGDQRLDSQKYEWSGVCPSDDWRYTHNIVHHNHTNVIGLDKDLGYGVMRITDQQPFKERFKRQFFLGIMTTVLFEWGVGIHRAEVGAMRDGEITREEMISRMQLFKEKALHCLFKEYVLLPAVAFWHWPYVLTGNIAANLMRNVWTAMVIFCGHFPKNVRVYTQEQVAGETRGDWYVRQIEGSANIDGGKWMNMWTGHLNHQIEHHLFPDIPSRRYPAIAPRIKAICSKYGLEYTSGPLLRQYAQAMGKIRKLRRPTPAEAGMEALPA
jgi:fatty acid desaturase